MQKWYHSQTAVFLTLLIVLLLTGWLRWFHFDSFPQVYGTMKHTTWQRRSALLKVLMHPSSITRKRQGNLLFWLTAVALRLGAGHLAPRWVAAVAGWVSVLLLFGAAHDILRPRLGHDAAWVAVGSATILGSNYAFLFNSRMGWEPTLATAVIIAAVWLFWRALRDGRRRDFLGAGIVIGITPYTSVIARSLPLLLLLIGLLWLPQMRHQWRSRLVGGALLGGTAVFLLSPLLRLFITQPELFNRRLAAAAEPATWARNLGLTLAGFLWRSGKALHSLPDRPIFGPALAVLLLIGSGVALWYWKRTSFLVWLLWLFSFIPAGMLSSPAPVFYRILPAVPAAAVLATLGGYWCIQQAARLSRWAQPIMASLIVGVVLFSGWTSSRDYLVRWAALPNLSGLMDAGKWQAAKTILAADIETAVFVTIPAEQEPTVQYAVQSRQPTPRTFDGQYCLVVPAKNEQPLHFLSINGYEHRSLPLLESLYETVLVTTDPFFANQSPYFYNVMVPSGTRTAIPGVLPEPIQFGDILLYGVDVAETAVSGQPLAVTLTWQTLTLQQRPLTAFVHLLQPDAGSASLVAQHDGIPCSGTEPVSHWRTNELILDEHIVDLPVEMENGRYLIGVGLYDTETFERLPVVDNEVDIRFGEAIIGAIDIQP